MKQEIQNRNRQERRKYVPATVKVVEVTAQKVICTSPGDIEKSGSDFGGGEILNF